jgi:hypothetical protein
MSEFEAENPHYYRRWRHMTEFMCREMMYDYLVGDLDKDRAEAMANFLAISREAKEDRQDLEYGLQYCELLSQSRIAPQLIQQLRGNSDAKDELGTYLYWRNWPAPLRWSAEAIVIATVFAFLTSMIPWHRLKLVIPYDRSQQIIAEIEKRFQEALVLDGGREAPSAIAVDVGASDHSLGSVDGGPEISLDTTEEHVIPPESKQMIEQSYAELEGEEESPIFSPHQPVVPSAPNAPNPGVVASMPNTLVASTKEPTVVDMEERGYIYKAYMNLPNVDEVSGEIANIIRGYDGKKAGGVELGWRKPNGSYYHFTIPESNYQKLEQALRTYGLVRIYKEKHKRVVPEGLIRLILWVEEVKPKPTQPNDVSNEPTNEPNNEKPTGEPESSSGEEGEATET